MKYRFALTRANSNRPTRFFFVSLAVLLIAVALVIFQSSPQIQAANSDSVAATYTQEVLHVSIPYQAPHAGAGRLTIDVLDPEDQVLAHSERSVGTAEGKGSWQQDLKLAKAVGIDELAWHRLRY